MTSILDTTRALLGPAPRAIDVRDHLEPPRWMKPDDPLRATYAVASDLLKNGDVVWGSVVQANTLLFKPGDAACPAQVVYGARVADDLPPDRLTAAARAVISRQGTAPHDPELARVAKAVTDEQARHAPMDLPSAITRGVPMRMAVVMIHRPHLPCGYLATWILPLIVSRDGARVAVLPARHWGPSLVTAWLDLNDRGA